MKQSPLLWCASTLARLSGTFVVSLALVTCTSPTAGEAPLWPPAPVSQAFILTQVYSDHYCFRHRYYWKDSLRNVRDICRVQHQFADSVNHVLVESHGWMGEYCDKNRFLLVRQGLNHWFVPLCDEHTLLMGTQRDTTFFKTDLVVAHPLNVALQGLTLKNRAFFLTGLFALCFPRRVTLTNYQQRRGTLELDKRTQSYLRPRLNQPQRYYYWLEQAGEQTLWEFDDTRKGLLQVRLIRPTWYRCFAM